MTKHIPILHTRLLISNSPGRKNGRSEWLRGIGGSGGILWNLLFLLEAFVEGGTLLGWSNMSQAWKGTVDALVLEVRTPEPVDGVDIRTPETSRMSPAFHSATQIVDEISYYLSSILAEDRYTIEYGKKVALCVKKIHLLLDGVEMKMWDVEALSYLQPGDGE